MKKLLFVGLVALISTLAPPTYSTTIKEGCSKVLEAKHEARQEIGKDKENLVGLLDSSYRCNRGVEISKGKVSCYEDGECLKDKILKSKPCL